MMKSFLYIFISIGFLGSCISPFKINQFKKGERHGKWVTYHDEKDKNIESEGRYKKGKQKRTWNYYNNDGKLVKREKFRQNNIQITTYHNNGKTNREGNAKIHYSDSLIHFYYYGLWQTYNEDGELIREGIYKDGILQSEKNYKSSKEKTVNDSLVILVKYLHEKFYRYHDSVRIVKEKHGKDSKEYNRIITLQNLNAIDVYNVIDDIISKFGYPGKSLVGNEYAIVFSIISNGNIEIKEKYYNIIIQAADKGELEWTDVAFFVDKIKIAKKEKQTFATQFMYSDKYEKLFFPIDNIDELNSRRKKVGLPELDINNIKQTDFIKQ